MATEAHTYLKKRLAKAAGLFVLRLSKRFAIRLRIGTFSS